MGLNLIYWTSICGKYFFLGSLLDFLCEKYGNTAVFPGVYGHIGEVPKRRLRRNWGIKKLDDKYIQNRAC